MKSFAALIVALFAALSLVVAARTFCLNFIFPHPHPHPHLHPHPHRIPNPSALSSLTDTSPPPTASQAALEARSQKVKEIRALRSYVDLAARDREHRGPPAGRGPPANRGPPGPPGPPANRGPPGPAGKGDRGHHYGEGNGNGNHGMLPRPMLDLYRSDIDRRLPLHAGKNLATDPNNCGAPFFVCPESCESPAVLQGGPDQLLTPDAHFPDNGLGDRVCDFGKCKLNCPPGLQHTVHAFFPEISFCA